jgi:hypothetical protein
MRKKIPIAPTFDVLGDRPPEGDTETKLAERTLPILSW